MTLPEFIRELHRCRARITGSYARGEQTLHSDYDFQIPESQWPKVCELFKRSGVDIESPFVMCLSTRSFHIMVETSVLFDRTPKEKRLEQVEIEGIIFKTWQPV